MLRSEINGGELWHSSAISKRIDSHVVETASGSHYLLFGDMDLTSAQQNGWLLLLVLLLLFHFFSQSASVVFCRKG